MPCAVLLLSKESGHDPASHRAIAAVAARTVIAARRGQLLPPAQAVVGAGLEHGIQPPAEPVGA